jgi:hypothetical protein
MRKEFVNTLLKVVGFPPGASVSSRRYVDRVGKDKHSKESNVTIVVKIK